METTKQKQNKTEKNRKNTAPPKWIYAQDPTSSRYLLRAQVLEVYNYILSKYTQTNTRQTSELYATIII